MHFNWKLFKKDIYNLRYALLVAFLYCLFMQLVFHNVCPLKAFFNIDCPACGLTRASILVFTGNIKAALMLNKTVFLWLVMIIAFIINRYITKLNLNLFPGILSMVCLVTILDYAINLIY